MRNLLTLISVVANVALIVIILLPDSYFTPTEDDFYVATLANERYHIQATHYCGKSLEEAAVKIFYAQDKPLSNISLDMLTALTKDAARNLHGTTFRRCEIKQLNITPAQGK